MRRASAGPARIVLDANILVSAVITSGRASGSALGHTVDRGCSGGAASIPVSGPHTSPLKVLKRLSSR